MTRKSRERPFEEIDGKSFVSTRVAAIICGVTQVTFNNWRRDDNPPPVDVSNGMVRLDQLGEWVRAEQVLKAGRGGAGFPYLPNIDRLYKNSGVGNESPETRLKRLQADKVQIDIDKSTGVLVPVEDVQEAWATILSRVRTRLLRLPVATAPLVTGLDNVHSVQEKLADVVREVLEELAAGETNGYAGSGTGESLDSDLGGQLAEVAPDGSGSSSGRRGRSAAPVAPS